MPFTMITAVIIDDEYNNREDLKALLASKFADKISVAGVAGSVQEGVKIINQTMPEIVFLDIRMPQEDGFSLFEKFDPVNFDVVFTTAYEEYAIKAIKHAAFDYLIKPVDPKDIQHFIDRYEKQKKKSSINDKIKTLFSHLENHTEKGILVSLPVGKEFKVINANDIIYCKANINYTELYLVNGKSVMVTKTLGKVEEILDYSFFFRCHRTYLVNLNHIDSYNRIDGYIKMKNGEVIYLATRRIEDFINIFGKKS